jgi:hypothetical protein
MIQFINNSIRQPDPKGYGARKAGDMVTALHHYEVPGFREVSDSEEINI